MTKMIVETAGQYMLMNLDRKAILHHRPCVALKTEFTDTEIASGRLKVYADNLPMKADDNEFVKVWQDAAKGNDKKSQRQKAIDGYCEQLGVDRKGTKLKAEDGKAGEATETAETTQLQDPDAVSKQKDADKAASDKAALDAAALKDQELVEDRAAINASVKDHEKQVAKQMNTEKKAGGA